MKKIIFVQKNDQSSYDPVSTFFSKSKPQLVAKQQRNTQLLSFKPHNYKSTQYDAILQKKQVNYSTSTKQRSANNNKQLVMTEKIRGKKQQINSGQSSNTNKVIQRQIMNTTKQQYEKLRKQTIYDLREKQRELNSRKIGTGGSIRNISQNNKTNEIKNSDNQQIARQNRQKKKDSNNRFQNRPQMVFDVSQRRDDKKDDDDSYGYDRDYRQQKNRLVDSKNRLANDKMRKQQYQLTKQQLMSMQRQVDKDESKQQNRLPQIVKNPQVISNTNSKKLGNSLSKQEQKSLLSTIKSDQQQGKQTKSIISNNNRNVQKNKVMTIKQQKKVDPCGKVNRVQQQKSNKNGNKTSSNNYKINNSNKNIDKKLVNNNNVPVSLSANALMLENNDIGSKLDQFTKQHEQKIEQLQIRIQALVKIQQKYNKLLKQYKQCKQRNNNYIRMQNQLKQTKNTLHQLLTSTQQQQSSNYIPYNTRRQFLLLNQINNLKKTNRELVLRIKSYKGTDLVAMAINTNKQQICRELDVQAQEESQLDKYRRMNVQMETNLNRLINLVWVYLEKKVNSGLTKQNVDNNNCGVGNRNILNNNKTKGQYNTSNNNNKPFQYQQFSLQTERKYLSELVSVAESLSLSYLLQYNISPLPKCNQAAIDFYAQIQQQKQNILNSFYIKKQLNKLIPIESINFAISQLNLEMINQMGENFVEMGKLQNKMKEIVTSSQIQKSSCYTSTTRNNQNRPTTSYTNTNNITTSTNNKLLTKQQLNKLSLVNINKKVQHLIEIYRKRSRISGMFYIQSVCGFVFMRQLLSRKMGKLQRQMADLLYRLKEMREIYQLGGSTAKQSLYLYLQQHLQHLTLTVSNQQLQINSVKSSYNQISSKLLRKQTIIIQNFNN